jgi:hypothetical protein
LTCEERRRGRGARGASRLARACVSSGRRARRRSELLEHGRGPPGHDVGPGPGRVVPERPARARVSPPRDSGQLPAVARPRRRAPVNRDLRDLLAAFLAADVRFVVVGAHAMAVHGVPRATGDLDVWIAPDPENADRAWSAVVRFGAPLSSMGVTRADFGRPDQVVQIGLPPRRPRGPGRVQLSLAPKPLSPRRSPRARRTAVTLNRLPSQRGDHFWLRVGSCRGEASAGPSM